jgi:hypothetical protein
MKPVATFGLVLCSLALVSCDAKKGADPAGVLDKPAETKALSRTTASPDGKKYVNEFFNVTVEKPEGWYAQNTQESEALREKGGQMVAGDDKNMKAMVEASKQSTTPLFSFFEVAPGTPGKANPNVIGIAEDLKAAPGVKTGCDYLALAKQMAEKSQVKIEFSEKCESKNINGSEFNFMDAQIKMGNQVIKQRYFARVQKEHALSMVQTFMDEESEAKVDKVIATLNIK